MAPPARMPAPNPCLASGALSLEFPFSLEPRTAPRRWSRLSVSIETIQWTWRDDSKRGRLRQHDEPKIWDLYSTSPMAPPNSTGGTSRRPDIKRLAAPLRMQPGPCVANDTKRRWRHPVTESGSPLADERPVEPPNRAFEPSCAHDRANRSGPLWMRTGASYH
jgi:hypothetical protein